MGGSQQGSHLYYKPLNQIIDRVRPNTLILYSRGLDGPGHRGGDLVSGCRDSFVKHRCVDATRSGKLR